MRALLSSTLTASAALLALTPATASAESASRLRIDHNTTAIYQYDPSPMGLGVLYDTVSVQAQLRNCPAGNYVAWVTLVQDGVSYPLASTARGVGEFSCTATKAQARVGMSFYGNRLHPGAARVTVTVYRQADGMPVLAETSRTVRIPAGYHQPGEAAARERRTTRA